MNTEEDASKTGSFRQLQAVKEASVCLCVPCMFTLIFVSVYTSDQTPPLSLYFLWVCLFVCLCLLCKVWNIPSPLHPDHALSQRSKHHQTQINQSLFLKSSFTVRFYLELFIFVCLEKYLTCLWGFYTQQPLSPQITYIMLLTGVFCFCFFFCS